MISKVKIRFIKSLQIKKYRKQEQCFVVEGAKSVQELLASKFEVATLLGTSEFLEGLPGKELNNVEVIEVTEKELEGLGQFQTNSAALAVARMLPNKSLSIQKDEFALVLDNIRDPGNLGTIIRIADWYGIFKIIASHETSDFYNPKVISASMGSFTRVEMFHADIAEYLANRVEPSYGTFLEGEDVHNIDFGQGGFIVIGNESQGISDEVGKHVTKKITIKRYGKAESLNAAVATAIVLDNLRRR